MKFIIPLILLIFSVVGLLMGVLSLVLALSAGGTPILQIPAIMLAVVSGVVNLVTLVPCVAFRSKSRICRFAAILSALGLVMVAISFVILAIL